MVPCLHASSMLHCNQPAVCCKRMQPPLPSTISNPRACSGLYHCNYCQKDISDSVRIKCADCPDFDLCLECFSVGVEIHPHKNTHRYRVVDNLCFPLYHPDWGVREPWECGSGAAAVLSRGRGWAQVQCRGGRTLGGCRVLRPLRCEALQVQLKWGAGTAAVQLTTNIHLALYLRMSGAFVGSLQCAWMLALPAAA